MVIINQHHLTISSPAVVISPSSDSELDLNSGRRSSCGSDLSARSVTFNNEISIRSYPKSKKRAIKDEPSIFIKSNLDTPIKSTITSSPSPPQGIIKTLQRALSSKRRGSESKSGTQEIITL